MSDFYGPRDDAQSMDTLERALELGVTFWDTSDAYGPHRNEELVGRAIRGRRDKFVIATKFGIVRKPSDPTFREINSRPEYVRSACEASLKRLGIDTIDLYYQHRVDPNTPIEDTVGAMAALVKEGKVRYLGLSEAAPETIRRACKIHPIAALQNEYSLWSREPEDGTLATCRELGVGLVAYSPLGRGFLTGQIRKFDDLAPDDFRRFSPRFQGENFDKNIQLVAQIEAIAKGQALHARSARAGMGDGARRRHRADTRHQAAQISRRERGRARRDAQRRGPQAPRRSLAERRRGRRQISRRDDGITQPLASPNLNLRHLHALLHRGTRTDRREPSRDARAFADDVGLRRFDRGKAEHEPGIGRDVGD